MTSEQIDKSSHQEGSPPHLLATRTGGKWQAGDAAEHRKKILSEILLSPNLLILCGLGTTRYIQTPLQTVAAPTMQDLWDAVAQDPKFAEICQKTSFPTAKPNIELLLSQCQLWQAISPSDAMLGFVERAEQTIVSKCRFVAEDTNLDVHEAF